MPNFFVPAWRWQLPQARLFAGKALGAIRNLRTDMGVGCRDEVAAAPHQAAVGIVRERADLGHGPDGSACVLREARRHRRPLSCRDPKRHGTRGAFPLTRYDPERSAFCTEALE